MKKSIVQLSKKLIAIPSIPENAQALDHALDTALENLQDYTIEKFEKNGYKSVLVYKDKKRPKKFKILLNGHLDILPGKEEQYKPKIIGDKLYGAGAMDMKASVACLITVFKEVANIVDYPLGLQIVTDEEPGGFNGTKYQIDEGVRTDFVISGEATNLNVVNKAKGVLWIKVIGKGKSAHSAYPWNGKNAIVEMNTFLQNVEKVYPTPVKDDWVTTVSVSNIETTNKTFNKIPDMCEAWLDIRFIEQDENKIFAKIKKLLPSGFTLQIVEKDPALFVEANNPYIKILQKIGKEITKKNMTLYGANGTSDARHFVLVKNAGIEFGPSGGGIGSDTEWVSIASLETYTKILMTFLKNFTK